MDPINWLEYTIRNNPNGVMLVLAKYGYVGYLAPQHPGEIFEACQMMMDQYGEAATEDLLRVHPDFDMIRSIPDENDHRGFMGGLYSNFMGFGSGSSQVISPLLSREALIAGGTFILAYLLFKS